MMHAAHHEAIELELYLLGIYQEFLCCRVSGDLPRRRRTIEGKADLSPLLDQDDEISGNLEDVENLLIDQVGQLVPKRLYSLREGRFARLFYRFWLACRRKQAPLT